MKQIRWSLSAANDLESLCDRIDRDNPEASNRIAQTLYNGCERLRRFPYIGRASYRMPGCRELVFAPLPYIVVYRVTAEAIEISRIFHGAQDWPSPATSHPI